MKKGCSQLPQFAGNCCSSLSRTVRAAAADARLFVLQIADRDPHNCACKVTTQLVHRHIRSLNLRYRVERLPTKICV
jgi:hypothetical protein